MPGWVEGGLSTSRPTGITRCSDYTVTACVDIWRNGIAATTSSIQITQSAGFDYKVTSAGYAEQTTLTLSWPLTVGFDTACQALRTKAHNFCNEERTYCRTGSRPPAITAPSGG
jgi:hypothetical protein